MKNNTGQEKVSPFLAAMWKVFLLRFSWGIFPIPTTIHCCLVQLHPSFTILGIMWFLIAVVAINRKKKKRKSLGECQVCCKFLCNQENLGIILIFSKSHTYIMCVYGGFWLVCVLVRGNILLTECFISKELLLSHLY